MIKRVSLKRITTLVLALTMMLSTVAFAESEVVELTDIENHWSKEWVDSLVGRGALSGYPDSTFKPDNTMTVAEFLSVALTSVDEDANKGVGQDYHWASTVLNRAYFRGIVRKSEVPATKEALDKPITRYEMARIAMRINEKMLMEPKTSIKGIEGLMLDYSQVPTEYMDFVEQAYMKGLLTGMDSGNFNGAEHGTRAQACVMIVRLLEESKRADVVIEEVADNNESKIVASDFEIEIPDGYYDADLEERPEKYIGFYKKFNIPSTGEEITIVSNTQAQMIGEQAKIFLVETLKTVRIYEEDGKYYIAVELAELPQDFYYQPSYYAMDLDGYYLASSSDRNTFRDTGYQVYELTGLTKSEVENGAFVNFAVDLLRDRHKSGSTFMKINTSMPNKIYYNDEYEDITNWSPFDTSEIFDDSWTTTD